MKRLQLFGMRPTLLALLLGALSLTIAPPAESASRSRPAAARTAKKKSKAKKKTTRRSRAKKKAEPKPEEEKPADEALTMPSLELDDAGSSRPAADSKGTLKVIDVTAASAAPAPVASEPGVAAASVEQPPHDEGSLVEVAAGVRLFRRDLLLGDPLARASPTYALDMAPAPFISAALFPGRGLSDAIPTPLGLGVSFEHAVGISSVVTGAGGAVEYPTRAHALQLELLGRFEFSRWELTGRAGYGWRSFSISDATDGTAKPRIPSVSYDHLSASGQARVRLNERIFLSGHAGARRVLAAGELADGGYFPGVSGFGLTAGAGLGFVLGPLEARLGVDLERYFLTLDPLSEQNASASDQFLGASLALAWRS